MVLQMKQEENPNQLLQWISPFAFSFLQSFQQCFDEDLHIAYFLQYYELLMQSLQLLIDLQMHL